MTITAQAPAQSRGGFLLSVWTSLHDSIGEIVFGMEDGTVSIFGLVFGVAATAPDATTVLLAGATGAAAAAVSMMAGTYLDVESARDQARAQLDDVSARIQRDPSGEAKRQHERLTAMGFSEPDATSIVTAIDRTPGGALNFASAFELHIGDIASKKPGCTVHLDVRGGPVRRGRAGGPICISEPGASTRRIHRTYDRVAAAARLSSLPNWAAAA